MPRKRKVASKINKIETKLNDDRQEIMKLLFKVQTNEVFHKKYTKELQQLYEKMDHDDFTAIFILCLKQLMQVDCNHFSKIGLKFMAEFVSTFQAEDMHPLFDSIFQWIFKTVSLTVSIRLRLCEFINLMLNSLPDDGDIEEFHCNEILSYMFARLKDISPHVRVQAIKALCRLQIVDDPDDEVTQIFLFHLEFDPCPLVRQAVLSSIARSTHTIPFIMKRLWDVDAKVRRSVLAHMSNFSLSKYTVEQRLTLLEQGLTDCSENVRNIALTILLPQWLASCDNNYLSLLSNLKLDEEETELSRFRKVARMSLLALFRSHDPQNLVNILPLIQTNDDTDNNYHRCIQSDKLTLELIVFWLTLIEFFQIDETKSEYLEQILPDLTTYCNYVAMFSRQMSVDSSDTRLSSQSILLILIEMLQKLDLSDEIGRESVKNIVVYLLTQSSCYESLTKSLINICEKLIPASNIRLQFYVDIVKSTIHPIDVNTNLKTCKNPSTVALIKAKLNALKGAETRWSEADESDKLASIQLEISLLKEHLVFLMKPFLPCEEISRSKRIPTINLLRSLTFIFYGVCSETVKSLIPAMYQLYEDVIRVHVDSENMEIRNWALKCTATFSLLYGKLAVDAFNAFSKELLCHQVKSIWVTSITAIFQLIDRYGLAFVNNNHNTDHVTAKNSLLNLPSVSNESIEVVPLTDNEYVLGSDILQLFTQYLDSSQDTDITCQLVDGFCMLILHGRFFDEKVMSKLILMYFNANMEPKIVQMLSIFFETLIRQKKQKYLQISLYETLTAIDKTENTLQLLVKFFVHSITNEEIEIESNATQTKHHIDGLLVTLLTWMDHHPTEHKSLNIISKEMLLLKVSGDTLKLDLMNLVDRLLQKSLHKETEKKLKLFKQIVRTDGTEAFQFSSIRPADGVEVDELTTPNESSDTGLEPEENYDANSEDGENNAVNDRNKSDVSTMPVSEKENQNDNVRRKGRRKDDILHVKKHRPKNSSRL